MVCVARGRAGSLAMFDGRYLTLLRKGVSPVSREERRVRVSQIVDIEWRPAGMLTRGFVRFVVPGAAASTSTSGARARDVRDDVWAVMFGRSDEPQFARLRAEVERAVERSHRDRSPQLGSDVLDQLQWLSHLRGSGALTESQFHSRRQELLEG